MSEQATTDTQTNDAAPAGEVDGAAAGEDTILGGSSASEQGEGGDQSTDGEKAPEGKQEEAKEGDDKPSLIGAPEKYDFADIKLADGVTFDKEAFDAVEPVLREMDLSQEAASKLVGAYAEKILPVLQARAAKQGEEDGAAIRADWARETQADKEIGGVKLDEAKAMAAKAMSKFLPNDGEGQKFRTFLNESGLGNHPEMVRFMARVGHQLGEASADQAGGKGAATDVLSELYPNNRRSS
jgi:hypothetical protein